MNLKKNKTKNTFSNLLSKAGNNNINRVQKSGPYTKYRGGVNVPLIRSLSIESLSHFHSLEIEMPNGTHHMPKLNDLIFDLFFSFLNKMIW
jgi:hypothetical protein